MTASFAEARLHYSPHTTSIPDLSEKVEMPFKYLARKLQIVFVQILRSLPLLRITPVKTSSPPNEPHTEPPTVTLPPSPDDPRGGLGAGKKDKSLARCDKCTRTTSRPSPWRHRSLVA